MKNMKSKALVLAAAVLWGTTGTSQAFAPDGATPLAIGAVRMAIGGIVMLVLAWLKEGRPGMKEGRSGMKAPRPLGIYIAGFCIGIYQPLFFAGVSMTGVAYGTVLAIGSAPVFTAIIEILKGRKPSPVWILSTVMALAGCWLLFAGQIVSGASALNVEGSLLSLGAGLSYAVYVQASKSLFESMPRLTVNGLIFFFSGVLLSPILLFSDMSWMLTPKGVMVSFHLGVVATAVAYTLFAYGLRGVPSSTAVTLTLGEPLTAATLGTVLFHESLSIIQVTGLIILLGGLMVATAEAPRKPGSLDLSQE